MECIHCTQCIDACDTIMHRIGKPVGLIRYSSQDALEGKKHSWVRPRTLIYPLLVLVTSTLFLVLLATKFAFDARVLSSPGAPYAINSARMLQNNFRVRLRNRTDKTETYTIQMLSPASASVQWSDEAPTLRPNESKLVPIMVTAPVGTTAANHGKIEAEVQLADQSGNVRKISVMLLGPG
jgi:polyferredoxin